MNGDLIKEANVNYNSDIGHPNITFKMNKEAALEWKEMTRNNFGKAIAIIVDNKGYTASIVKGEIIDGKSQITGAFIWQEADLLVDIIISDTTLVKSLSLCIFLLKSF